MCEELYGIFSNNWISNGRSFNFNAYRNASQHFFFSKYFSAVVDVASIVNKIGSNNKSSCKEHNAWSIWWITWKCKHVDDLCFLEDCTSLDQNI